MSHFIQWYFFIRNIARKIVITFTRYANNLEAGNSAINRYYSNKSFCVNVSLNKIFVVCHKMIRVACFILS